jgi:hypothetical protein
LSIQGKILFKIKNADFFEDIKKRGVASLEELSEYLPVSFYVSEGHFFIPNRLSDEIYEFTITGQVVNKIQLPIDFDIAQFYLDKNGNKHVRDAYRGLVIFNKENKIVYHNDSVTFLTPTPKRNNALIVKRNMPINKLAMPEEIKSVVTDELGLIGKSNSLCSGYCQHYLDDEFLFEMNYSDKEDAHLGRIVKFIKYNLRSLELISRREIKLNCRNCFDLPKFLSESMVISTNYSDKGNPVNELIVLDKENYRTYTLAPEVKIEAGSNIFSNFNLMNRGFVYSYDDYTKKLYSVATSKTDVVVMEYDLP